MEPGRIIVVSQAGDAPVIMSLDGLPPERIRWETIQGVRWLDQLHTLRQQGWSVPRIAALLGITPQTVRNYEQHHRAWVIKRKNRNGKRPRPYPEEAEMAGLRGIWRQLPADPATGRRLSIRNGSPVYTEVHDELFKLTAAGFGIEFIAVALKVRQRDLQHFLADPLPIKHIQKVVHEHRRISQGE